MEKNIFDSITKLDLIGIIGGLIGSITGIWALIDRYKNRKPKLKVFAPFIWKGNDSVTNELIWFVFFRIANLSQASTFLYFETAKIDVFDEKLNTWENVQIIKVPEDKFKTDFLDPYKSKFGMDHPRFLDGIYLDCSVKFGAPLCGYLAFKCQTSQFNKLTMQIRDFKLDNRRKFKFLIDFSKQKSKFDPTYKQ